MKFSTHKTHISFFFLLSLLLFVAEFVPNAQAYAFRRARRQNRHNRLHQQPQNYAEEYRVTRANDLDYTITMAPVKIPVPDCKVDADCKSIEFCLHPHHSYEGYCVHKLPRTLDAAGIIPDEDVDILREIPIAMP